MHFETKLSMWGLVFMVSSGLVNFEGTRIIFAVIYFRNLKMVYETRGVNPSQRLKALQHHVKKNKFTLHRHATKQHVQFQVATAASM